jgi:serine/threonine-protein kinase
MFLTAISVLLSLGMFALTRIRRIPPHRLVDLGLVYEVLGALGISLGFLQVDFGADPLRLPYLGLSWVCVWIIIFPLLVPATPLKSLLAALVAASMDPIVVLFGYGSSTDLPSSELALLLGALFYPNYLCAVLAWYSSHIMHRLGREVTAARELGSYQLVERLGSGGMGEVWRAKHRMLARPAAIKLIRPEMLGTNLTAATSALKRFEREAQATANLRSPHTVELYDFGITDDGTFYYVMELLDGLDLETLVERYGPQPPGRVVHLLEQACRSLEDAHFHGMLHRDVKPANIFTCRMGSHVDFVKVLDFGIVKSFEGDGQDTKLTIDGVASGTPAFMAPELALGEKAVDGRADLYSLGCVAYWLLTGHLVFKAETPMKTLVEHVRTPPVPPSQRTERPIPAVLEQLVLECLEKEPAGRPSSAREIAGRLAACSLEAPWTEGVMQQWWEQHVPVSRAAAQTREAEPA